ncbi:MAG: ABC transporter ATP-binding protein [Planctomycetota bacterium]|nr:MAG: ABC transporter ATP-binding protein [Planctomycetota bacterium]
MGDLIVVDNLTRMFGSFTAIKDVSFSFDSGSIFGFIGPNGAGKTTTMRILSTLDIATTGDAFINGYSVIDEPDKVRSMIGFMPDYYGAPKNMTIKDYLDFFARAYLLKGEKRRKSVEYVIDFMDMKKIQDKHVVTLSKGMKQRLCLGRALIHDPKILILDEPAAGLDPRARIELRELLKILAERGKAILISSHILTELSELCDSCAIIEQGKILSHGNVNEIQESLQLNNKSLPVISLSLLEPNEDILIHLNEIPFVEQVEEITKGKKFKLKVNGNKNQIPQILKNLIDSGYLVMEFKLEGQNLEDLFLNITKGEVQ